MVRLLFILLLTGCITEEKCLQRFPPKESFKETIKEYYRDSVIEGATVTDTVYFQGKTIERNHWYTVLDTTGKAELRYMVDQYGNLIAQCAAKDQTIKGLIKEVMREKETVIAVADDSLPCWVYVVFIGGPFIAFWLGGKIL